MQKALYQCYDSTVCIEYTGKKYCLFIKQKFSDGSIQNLFVKKSKSKPRVERLVSTYTEVADLIGTTEQHLGWNLDFSSLKWNVYKQINYSSKQKAQFSVYLRAFAPLSKRKAARMKKAFPNCSTEDFEKALESKLNGFSKLADKQREKVFLQQAVSQMPQDSGVDELLETLQKLQSHKKSLSPYKALEQVGLKNF